MDSVLIHARRDAQREMADHREVELATVLAYNPATHRANVALSRGGSATSIFVAYPFGLWPWRKGDTCTVLLVLGAVVQVVGPVPADDGTLTTPPRITLPDDVDVLGMLTATGPIRPGVMRVLPAASAAWANVVVTLAAAGADSLLYYCQAKADGSHTWRAITLT